MVDTLNSKMISLVVTQYLEHNCYSESEDVQCPIDEFYDMVFPLEKVLDKNFNRNTLLNSRISIS